MIHVFHNPKFMDRNPEHVALMTGEELVAKVDTDDLNVAYELTNHIDTSWWDNDLVTCLKQSRSSSIGDFFADDKGSWWMVDSIGFTKVSKGG